MRLILDEFTQRRPTDRANASRRRWSFSKTFFKPDEFENAGPLRFRMDEKHFEMEAFRK